MGRITLTKIILYAYHGCLEEERKIGSEYRVDVTVKTNLQKAAASDALQDTVDYVHLNRIVKEEMAIPSNLLEHVASRILHRILEEIAIVSKAYVSVSKITPPVEGNVEKVTVSLQLKKREMNRG